MRTISHSRLVLWPILGSIAITLCLWMGSKWLSQTWFDNPWKYIAKTSSLSTTMLMCWGLILSTRASWLENLWGGLDKVYQVHKRVGRWAFICILAHPVFLYVHHLPDIGAFFGEMLLPNIAESDYLLGQAFGVLSHMAMAVLVALTIWIKPPYHIWKKIHEWFGLVVLLVMIHIGLVDADIADYPLLQLWMWAWLLAAMFSFIYIRFLYRFFARHYKYRLSHVERHADVLDMTFSPVGKAMDFKPSQFVYLVVNKEGITPEPHPYSIASGFNLAGRFKLGIRESGDHTRTMHALAPGDEVTVYGPYGRFSDAFLENKRDCIFIGGGIGITPFLGMWHVALHSEDQIDEKQDTPKLEAMHPEMIRSWVSPKVNLFYVCQKLINASFDYDIRREVILSRFHGLEELENRKHDYELYLSKEKGRFTAEYVQQKVPEMLKRNIFMCGPSVMVDSLRKQFMELGVPEDQIIVEDFNLI